MASAKLITYIALLRGINVGGKTMVSMATLRDCFAHLGYRNVTTQGNSGNVIFRTPQPDRQKLGAAIEEALVAATGKNIRVVVRSFADMTTIMQHLPASWHESTAQKCNLIFLHHSIDTSDLLEQLHPEAEIEEVHYYPGVLFWSAQTSALTRSNMIKLSTSPVYKAMTVRIISAVQKIYAVMRHIDELPPE